MILYVPDSATLPSISTHLFGAVDQPRTWSGNARHGFHEVDRADEAIWIFAAVS